MLFESKKYPIKFMLCMFMSDIHSVGFITNNQMLPVQQGTSDQPYQ